jgi:hypothetical protein
VLTKIDTIKVKWAVINSQHHNKSLGKEVKWAVSLAISKGEEVKLQVKTLSYLPDR